MAELVQNMQKRFKSGSTSAVLLLFRLVSAFFVGLVMSIIGQELIGYSSFSYWFVIVVFAGLYMKVTKSWSTIGVLALNLILFLIGLLLRLYILVAPGA